MQASAPPPPPPPQPPPSAQPTPAERGWSTTPRAPSIETQPPAGRATVASLSATPPAVAASGFYVQTGAFTTPENAERQRNAVRTYGSSEVLQASAGGRGIWRVRLGPYTTQDAAGIVADRLRRSGFGDARVVTE
ncbi:MAG: SPOR domain-containing protein [Proteobacteria bacterium]|nr:SPOR domain-containing protein [Pseudomonadota bacterium]